MERINKLFTIGQFAALHGINKKTLMWYDEIGLFRPASLDPSNGYRLYSYRQSAALETILLLRELDVSARRRNWAWPESPWRRFGPSWPSGPPGDWKSCWGKRSGSWTGALPICAAYGPRWTSAGRMCGAFGFWTYPGLNWWSCRSGP